VVPYSGISALIRIIIRQLPRPLTKTGHMSNMAPTYKPEEQAAE
jgi:hypothetical protein